MVKTPLVLTPNRRLTRYLQQHFYATATENHVTAWRSEKILPLSIWLKNCWQEQSADSRILLSSHQERLLWQRVIRESLGEEFIGLADSVGQAYELLISWQLGSKWGYTTEDVLIFQRLKKKFTAYCKQKRLVVACQLPDLLCSYLQDLEITFTDFDEYSPQMQTFIAALQRSNKIYYNNSNSYSNSLYKKISFGRQDDEIVAVACWAKQIVETDPQATIGIIVANLPDLRAKIIRIFTAVFGDTENKINISAGVVFSTLPIVNIGLEVLFWHEPFSLKTISKILLTSYLSAATKERSKRAELDFQLRQLDQAQFTLAELEFLAKKYSLNISLFTCLKKLQNIFAQVKSRKLYSSEWTKIFTQIVQALGWPGENNLTTTEFAAVKRFTELLQEFATTDLVVGKVTYKQARQNLFDLAEHTVFQAEDTTDAPVNILGALEAAGMNFTYLWVMGLDQENWPRAPTPNPFIPIQVQKKFGLPHASAERELYFCEILIKRLKRSAKEVIFSYVNQIEDRVIAPSYFLADIPEVVLDLPKFVCQAKRIYASKKMEELDDTAVILVPDELKHTGVRLIELQALCPFRAFAEFRLHAQGLKQFESGVSKIKRGILVHAALERFWQEVKTQQQLCELSQEALHGLINDCIHNALAQEHFSASLYRLEQQCLHRLLHFWLEAEKNRASFTVLATEQAGQMILGALQIRFRVDRIDELADGRLLLIDYKTGKKLPLVLDWFGARPKNPQLPLYCVAINNVEHLALAQVNIAAIKFKDINIDELADNMRRFDETNFKNNLTWQELRAYWERNLIALAQDFISGQVQPDPLTVQVCQQCEFNSICRYNKITL